MIRLLAQEGEWFPLTFGLNIITTITGPLCPEFLSDALELGPQLDNFIDESYDCRLTLYVVPNWLYCSLTFWNRTSLKTLEASYLLRNKDGHFVERPQFLFMRVSLALHCLNITRIVESYRLMASQHFIHAPPTPN